MNNSNNIEVLKEYLTDSNYKGVALTGSGISAESGIPTFRKEGGLWSKYDSCVYADLKGLLWTFLNNPKKLSQFIIDVYTPILNAHPNIAHKVLAKLVKEYNLKGIITQNIDNLHTEAYQAISVKEDVIMLHGNIYRARCKRCLKTYRIKKEKIKKFIQKLKEGKNSRTKLYRLYRNLYPECKCGSHFRPDVVLFGEPLDQQVVNKAYQLLNDCHYLLLIGTSSVVYPASSLPVYAKEQGAKIIEINPESTELSNIADYNIYDNAGSVFKKIDNILK